MSVTVRPQRPPRIFLIDPGVHYARLLTALLTDAGYHDVRWFASTDIALEALSELTCDTILIDQDSKPDSAVDFTRMLRRDHVSAGRFTPVILMASQATPEVVTKARDAGVTEILVKPVSAGALAMRVRTCLELPRNFIQSGEFFGPDRRRRKGTYDGPERRNRAPTKVEMPDTAD
ncbi:MAG: response regulator [Alphaproteobacteria bacterium]|nr:response regulator [Alphaproteobacteria bacterium]